MHYEMSAFLVIQGSFHAGGDAFRKRRKTVNESCSHGGNALGGPQQPDPVASKVFIYI